MTFEVEVIIVTTCTLWGKMRAAISISLPKTQYCNVTKKLNVKLVVAFFETASDMKLNYLQIRELFAYIYGQRHAKRDLRTLHIV